MEYILPQTDGGIKDKIQNYKAGRSGLKELGGGIDNGPDQSLRLTAPPAVLYPGLILGLCHSSNQRVSL